MAWTSNVMGTEIMEAQVYMCSYVSLCLNVVKVLLHLAFYFLQLPHTILVAHVHVSDCLLWGLQKFLVSAKIPILKLSLYCQTVAFYL